MAMLVDPERPLAKFSHPVARRRRIACFVQQTDIIEMLARLPQPRQRAVRPKRLIWPLMQRIATILRRHAGNGSEMPNNPMLGRLLGLQHYSSAYRALKRMHAVGMLVLEIESHRRRVIFPDGRATCWGITRPGHAPFSANPRGTTPKPKPIRPPRRNAYLPPPPVPYGPVIIVAAECCQWPAWSDDSRPTDAVCGQPTVSRRISWCMEHHARATGRQCA